MTDRPRVALLPHRAAIAEPTGIGRYYVEMVSSLAARATYDYALCTTRERELADWIPAGMERLQFPGPRKAVAVLWALAGRPRVDRAFGHPDLLHALHPWTATPSRAPLVTSVHDLLPLQHPEWYPRAESLLYRRGIAHARKHAALVIVHSAHGADEIVETAGFDPARVRVVHLAVSDTFRRPVDAAQAATICAEHGVEPGRFLIAVGQVNDRKNLTVVLRALDRVDPRRLGSRALIIAGAAGPGADRVRDEIARLRLDGRVHLAGRLADDHLHALLASARALVHPSRAEGFGFTPIEAMAAGTVAIAGDAGAVPEMVGAGGLLVDPDDVDAWAAAIDSVAGDDDRHARLLRAGGERQEHFRWSRVAEETERVYADVLGGRR